MSMLSSDPLVWGAYAALLLAILSFVFSLSALVEQGTKHNQLNAK